MIRRRPQESIGRAERMLSDFVVHENGESPLHDGGSKPVFRRLSNRLRLRLGQLFKDSRGSYRVVGLAYISICFLLLWAGTQLPVMLNPTGIPRGAAGSRTNGGSWAVSAEPAVKVDNASADGPTLAYGIMVYQRQGYHVNTTLAQFTRMFDALYDELNT